MKIELSDIKTQWLNKKALVLISIFANEAYKLENITIDLQADNVLEEISYLAKTTQDDSLKQLYSNIKRELKVSIYNAAKNEHFAEEIATLQTHIAT